MIESDDFIEEHQIHVPEILLSFAGQFQLWLAVFDVIVGEVAYQTAGKGRHFFRHRAFISGQDLTECISRMIHVFCRYRLSAVSQVFPDGHLTVKAGDFHGRIVSKEGVPTPCLFLTGALQQVAVSAGFS